MERNSCYNCKYFASGYAECRNKNSQYYCGWVTIDDVCEEWEEDEEDDILGKHLQAERKAGNQG